MNEFTEFKEMREILIWFSALFIRLLLMDEAKKPSSHWMFQAARMLVQ